MAIIDRTTVYHTLFSFIHSRTVKVSGEGVVELDNSALLYPYYKYAAFNTSNKLLLPIVDMYNPYACFVFRFSGLADCDAMNSLNMAPGAAKLAKSQLVAVGGFYIDENVSGFSFTHMWREKDTGFMLQLRENVTSVIKDFITGEGDPMGDTTINLISKVLGLVDGGDGALSNFVKGFVSLRQILVNSKIIFPEKELKIYDGFKFNSQNFTVEKLYITKTSSENIYQQLLSDISTLDLWPKLFFVGPSGSTAGQLPPILQVKKALQENPNDETLKKIYEELVRVYAEGFVLFALLFYDHFENPDNRIKSDYNQSKFFELIQSLFPVSSEEQEKEGFLSDLKSKLIRFTCYNALKIETYTRPRPICAYGSIGVLSLYQFFSTLFYSGDPKNINFTAVYNNNELANFGLKEVEGLTWHNVGRFISGVVEFFQGDNKTPAANVVLSAPVAAGAHVADKALEELGVPQGPEVIIKNKIFTFAYSSDDPFATTDFSKLPSNNNTTIILNKAASYVFFPASIRNSETEPLIAAVMKDIVAFVNDKYKQYVPSTIPAKKEDYINNMRRFFESSANPVIRGLTTAKIEDYNDVISLLAPALVSVVKGLGGYNAGSGCHEIGEVPTEVLAFLRALLVQPPSSYNYVPYYREYVKALYEGYPEITINGIRFSIGYYGIVLLNIRRITLGEIARNGAADRTIYYLLPEDVEVTTSNTYVYSFNDTSTPFSLNFPTGNPLWIKLKITLKPINDYIHIFGNFLGLRNLLLLLGDQTFDAQGGSSGGSGSSTVSNTGGQSSPSAQATSTPSVPYNCTNCPAQ